MARRPKGFDPLSSLFEAPPTEAGIDEIPVGDTEAGHGFPPAIELTDPFFSAPEEGPQAPARRLLTPQPVNSRSRHLTSGDPDIATPEEVLPPPPVRPREGLPVSAGALPPEFRSERLSDPPPAPPAAPATDPVALARALAKAAAAKAGPPPPRPPDPVAPTPVPEASAPPAPPRPLSRVEALSQRAVRPRTALEVIQQAQHTERTEERRAEERRREVEQQQGAAPAPSKPPIVVKVQRLLERKLRGLGPFTVRNCLLLDDREILRALWRAHRARFGAEGKLDQVVAAAAVLDSLDLVPEGKLVAAHVLTDASDYLVWVDMREGTPLAAFANARAYFVAGQGD